MSRNCFICELEAIKRCKSCNGVVCIDCIDDSNICLSCKFETLDKLKCLNYINQNTEIDINIKPKYLFLPLIAKQLKYSRKSFLNAIEHLYFCDKGCTVKDIIETKNCCNIHKLKILYHNNMKYHVYHLKDRYYRIKKNGLIWYVTDFVSKK